MPNIIYSYSKLLKIISYLIIINGSIIILKKYTKLILSLIFDIFISVLTTIIFIIGLFIVILYFEATIPNCKNIFWISLSQYFYVYYIITMSIYIFISSLNLTVFNSYIKYKQKEIYFILEENNKLQCDDESQSDDEI